MAEESLPAFLRSVGLRTVLISPFGERHSAWTFYSGFNEIHNTGQSGTESAEEVTPTMLDWVRSNGIKDDWFLYVNYWDAHTPYRAPLDYGNPFENEPLQDWITDNVLESHIKKVGPHSASEINMFDNCTSPKYPRQPWQITDRTSLRNKIDGYDTGIRYMDDLIIIITADNGENQVDLGIYGEHGTADHATCRIPMIIRWPGKTKASVDEGFHYHLDINLTLSELFEHKPMKSWDGQSYASFIRGDSQAGRNYLVVSQCAHVCQRSVRFGDYIYVRTYHDGYHLFNKEMLFNLKVDPFEQTNLAAELPSVCREAVYLLNEWHDEMMFTMNFDVDPLWTVIKTTILTGFDEFE